MNNTTTATAATLKQIAAEVVAAGFTRRFTFSSEEYDLLEALREDGTEEAGRQILAALPEGTATRLRHLACAARAYEEGMVRLEEAAAWYAAAR